MASAPAPVNISESSGRSTLTDFSTMGESARTGTGSRTATINMVSGKVVRTMVKASSTRNDGRCFDDVAHEAGRIPIAPVRLRHPTAVGAADHQRVAALGRQGDLGFPLPKSIF